MISCSKTFSSRALLLRIVGVLALLGYIPKTLVGLAACLLFNPFQFPDLGVFQPGSGGDDLFPELLGLLQDLPLIDRLDLTIFHDHPAGTEDRVAGLPGPVIDKVIGKAAAFICILRNVKAVYTPVASESAKILLAEKGIDLQAKKVIPEIRNSNKTDQCPMEKMADAAGSPELFYKELEARIKIE